MNSNTSSSKEEYRTCAGKGCKSLGRIRLKINYINKKGAFCDTCSADLLQQGLAVKEEEVVI